MRFSISSKIIGINYGIEVSRDYINNNNLQDKLNLKMSDVLYKCNINNNKYLVKVSKISDNENNVFIYLDKNLLDEIIFDIEKWCEKL